MMPRILAGLLALTAVAASILAGKDSVSILVAGGAAGSVGWFLGGIWQSLVGVLMMREEAAESSDEQGSGHDSDDEGQRDLEQAA